MCHEDRTLSMLQMENAILWAIFSLKQALDTHRLELKDLNKKFGLVAHKEKFSPLWLWPSAQIQAKPISFAIESHNAFIEKKMREGWNLVLKESSHWRNENLVRAGAEWLTCDQLKIAITHLLSTCTAHNVSSQGKMLWRGPNLKWQNSWI